MLGQKLKRFFFSGTNTPSLWLLVVFSAIATTWAWFAPTTRSAPTDTRSIESIPDVSEIGLSQQRVEAELITIRPTGFEPTQITRSEGPFILAVDNRSGLEEVKLQLNLETGRREREALVHRKQLDWRDYVDLRPGQYVLKEVNHPDWSCLITITRN